MGDWEPTPAFFERLMARDAADADLSRPYPFFLAHALEQPLEDLGDRGEWQAEWKWDGIRSQLIRRGGQTFLWSRGEELVTERYPELAPSATPCRMAPSSTARSCPGNEGRVLPFAQLQRRIGRKAVTRTILAQVPVVIMAYDLLEFETRTSAAGRCESAARRWPSGRRAGLENPALRAGCCSRRSSRRRAGTSWPAPGPAAETCRPRV